MIQTLDDREPSLAPMAEQALDAGFRAGVRVDALHVHHEKDGAFAHAGFSSSASSVGSSSLTGSDATSKCQRPFASEFTNGLCAISHRCPSGSAK